MLVGQVIKYSIRGTHTSMITPELWRKSKTTLNSQCTDLPSFRDISSSKFPYQMVSDLSIVIISCTFHFSSHC